MKASDIVHLRLQNQQITQHHFKSVKTLVTHMGAMQAQDEAMWRWAIGIRQGKPSLKKVEDALGKGEILRTHVLRPTWHLVAAEDIHWMLNLTAPDPQKYLKARHNQLEITPGIITKSRKIIEKLLTSADFITRKDLHTTFTKAKIATNEHRLSHIMYLFELEALVASGPLDNGKHTYALLDKRVKKKIQLHRDEALAELAMRYFTSHGPATLPDFHWWSGLSLNDARKALESIKNKLDEIKVNDHVYWMKGKTEVSTNKSEVFFLPAFDEFLISYKDRSAAIEKQNQAKAFSINGIFFPIIVSNGKVAGTWKRSFVKDKVKIETKFFGKPAPALQPAIKKAAKAYTDFLGKKPV